MSIIGGLFLRSRASRNTPFFMPEKEGVGHAGKMQLQVQARETGTI